MALAPSRAFFKPLLGARRGGGQGQSPPAPTRDPPRAPSLRRVLAAGGRRPPGHVWAAGCCRSGALEPEPRPPREHPGKGFRKAAHHGSASPSTRLSTSAADPGDTATGQGRGTLTGNGGTGGCWLRSRLPRGLEAGPPPTPLRGPPRSQQQPPSSKNPRSEAKSSWESWVEAAVGAAAPGLGAARAPPEPGNPPPTPSSWRALIPGV